MNYLAHLYLAGNDEGLIIGNFIADSVRGKEIDLYSKGIQDGIKLHRKIDQFTDTHPIVKTTTTRLRSSAGKYAPVVVDIVYDHFLAANWSRYSLIPLQTFTENKYRFLTGNIEKLPEKMHELLTCMIQQDWLMNYASLNGIAQTLSELSEKASFANTMATSIIDIKKDYQTISSEFSAFFPEIQNFVKNEINLISND